MDRNYEQEYKKAFEAAKGLHDAGNALTKKQMEIVFPQLAESEDERIRKEIVAAVEMRGDLTQGRKSEIYAYLEKQKERGPLTKEEEYILHRIIEYLEDETCPSEWISLLHDIYCLPYEKQKEPHFTKRNALFDKCVENCDPEIMKRVSDEVDAMLQKEQKPSQTDDEREYVKTLKGLVSDFVRDCGGSITDVGYYQRICDWLDGRHIEQKPAEWKLPEDFEEAVYKVANFISPFDSQEELRKVSHRFAEQLLSLAKKELDKLLEWSEEDTEMYINVASSLRGYACGLENEEHKRHIKKGLDWLENRFKSLRPQPHWKPNEEQMKALLGAEGISRASGYPDNAKVLASLYEEFKKL